MCFLLQGWRESNLPFLKPKIRNSSNQDTQCCSWGRLEEPQQMMHIDSLKAHSWHCSWLPFPVGWAAAQQSSKSQTTGPNPLGINSKISDTATPAQAGFASGAVQGHLTALQFPPLPLEGRVVANSRESARPFSAPIISASGSEEGILDLALRKISVLPDCTHSQHPLVPDSSFWRTGAEGSCSSW